jgi:hypothetical protein
MRGSLRGCNGSPMICLFGFGMVCSESDACDSLRRDMLVIELLAAPCEAPGYVPWARRRSPDYVNQFSVGLVMWSTTMLGTTP